MVKKPDGNGRERRRGSSRGYPRPLLERNEWWDLNGKWDFALDHPARWHSPKEVAFNQRITVPFSPETPASGIGDTGFYKAVWYRRTIVAPELAEGDRLMLHFGAVDYETTVWVNGGQVGHHIGGYTPFSMDITSQLKPEGEQEIVVCAYDDPADLEKPRGKQDWKLDPHSIWYPRTTGIWQTVWMERVPHTAIEQLLWRPNVERWEIDLLCRLRGDMEDGMKLNVRLQAGETLLAQDSYTVIRNEVHRRIALSDPGIDDFRNELLWWPSTPQLIQAEVELTDRDGRCLDSVRSYTAMRSIGIQGDRFVLNSRPFYLRMILDQGYWPHTGLTSPDDRAIRTDIELAKAMGFNGVRRHQKVSDPRFLYWADTLGLLVWSEMPSAYRYTRRSIERLSKEWVDVVNRDMGHPCVIAWVPFNESWGVPDLPDSPAQRHYVQALYHLTKTLDPSRPVIGNDGWESVATDILGIHDYDDQPERIMRRYGTEQLNAQLFQRERPGGRLLTLEGDGDTGQPLMITEFGGIALSKEEGSWGYSRADDPKSLGSRYAKLLEAVRRVTVFAGFCYTQFADTYQESNGLLWADRTPKFPLEQIALATAGAQGIRDREIEMAWRERMMSAQWSRSIIEEEHRIQST